MCIRDSAGAARAELGAELHDGAGLTKLLDPEDLWFKAFGVGQLAHPTLAGAQQQTDCGCHGDERENAE